MSDARMTENRRMTSTDHLDTDRQMTAVVSVTVGGMTTMVYIDCHDRDDKRSEE